jgi:phosphoglycolate phosphatase-like HAD superfamily hydrolase
MSDIESLSTQALADIASAQNARCAGITCACGLLGKSGR